MFALHLIPFNPAKTFSMVCRMFTPTASMSGITLSWHEGLCEGKLSKNEKSVTSLPEKLVGDERRLMQVLINIVKNALDYTISGMIKIFVSYDHNRSSLHVHVHDTGRGIAQEDLYHIFDHDFGSS